MHASTWTFLKARPTFFPNTGREARCSPSPLRPLCTASKRAHDDSAAATQGEGHRGLRAGSGTDEVRIDFHAHSKNVLS